VTEQDCSGGGTTSQPTCRTVYDNVSQQECNTVNEQECKSVWREVCDGGSSGGYSSGSSSGSSLR
jgi:hypothetical protein